MTEWTAKRFWDTAGVVPKGDGHAVELDGRPVKTPAKATLILPTQGLAEKVAEEWNAQSDIVDPISMPFTRSSNAAIDKVAAQFGEVAALIAEYGDSDLICYRAQSPKGLRDRQDRSWDPLMDWAANELSAPMNVVEGVLHRAQPDATRARFSELVENMGNFELTALHDLVSLSGSLVIGLAIERGFGHPELLWETSRIDEQWQIDEWGEDEEAIQTALSKRRDFLHAADFLALSRK